jgi:hypothetical protein
METDFEQPSNQDTKALTADCTDYADSKIPHPRHPRSIPSPLAALCPGVKFPFLLSDFRGDVFRFSFVP